MFPNKLLREGMKRILLSVMTIQVFALNSFGSEKLLVHGSFSIENNPYKYSAYYTDGESMSAAI